MGVQTQRGHEQARAGGEQIKEILDGDGQGDYKLFFYMSPYKRSKQTYEGIAAQFGRSIVAGTQEEVQLREQDFGNFQVRGVIFSPQSAVGVPRSPCCIRLPLPSPFFWGFPSTISMLPSALPDRCRWTLLHVLAAAVWLGCGCRNSTLAAFRPEVLSRPRARPRARLQKGLGWAFQHLNLPAARRLTVSGLKLSISILLPSVRSTCVRTL